MEISYKIYEFAEIAGVSIKTLRRWDKSGILVANRTAAGHYRYTQHHVDILAEVKREYAQMKSNKSRVKGSLDLTGQIFGQLKVIGRADDIVRPSGRHVSAWCCECLACGKETIVSSGGLRAGYNKTCGCCRYGDNETKKMWDAYFQMSKNDVCFSHEKKRVGRPSGFKGGE